MKINFKNVFKIIGVYIAMIVGAGFASGQELIQFFIKFNEKGLLGIVVAAFLFAFIGYAVMWISFEKKYATNNEFIRGLFGDSFGSLLEIIIGFLFLTFYFSMISASGAALNQVFNIPFTIAAFIVSILCFSVLSKDLDGIVKINSILSPIMFFGGIVSGIYILMAQNTEVFANNSLSIVTMKDTWFISAIIYASYNIVTSISVLSSMKDTINNKKTALVGAIISGLCLATLGIFLGLPLLSNFEFAKNFELPILALIGKYSSIMEFIYLIVLLIAIFSTAIGNGFAFVTFVNSRLNIRRKFISIGLCIFGFIMSHFGFSSFVSKVYPLFGIVGFLQIVTISYTFVKLKVEK